MNLANYSPAGIGIRSLFGGGSSPASSDTTASDIYAKLTRDQWSTYVNTFIPIENQLIQYATDATLPAQQMAQASQNVNAAFNQQEGATARRLKGLGVTLSPEEQAAQQKQYGLNRALADVQAQNTTGDLVRQRQQSILGNPAPT
jgi:hypothetical protein